MGIDALRRLMSDDGLEDFKDLQEPPTAFATAVAITKLVGAVRSLSARLKKIEAALWWLIATVGTALVAALLKLILIK